MNLKEIEKKVAEIIPPACNLTKVDYEGSAIVIYIKNFKEFYNHENLLKELASSLRKKVIVRSDPSVLLDVAKAQEKIYEILPKEVEIKSIRFIPEFCEVRIEAVKPGLAIGKNATYLKQIAIETNWLPVVERSPTIPSTTLEGIRKSFAIEAGERKKFLQSVGKKLFQNSIKSEWFRAVFLGGFREVGRSCMLVQTQNSKVLIDCGVNPVTAEPSKAYPYLNMLGFPLDQLDAVIISHGHMDHMGFLPYLFQFGYDGPVYATPPTRDFMALLQQDYINLMKKSFGVDPPYTKKDIQKQLRNVITVDYNEVVDISPEIKLTFYNAGHILGSAIVHLHFGEGLHNLVYTGDFKFGFTRLFDPAHTKFVRVESLFIESTYGGKEDFMPSRADSEKMLIKVIEETVAKRGVVLIPVFAVGRSQEILLVLEDYYRKNPDFNVPIYIDGMVLEASAIHTAYPEYLRESLERRILSNQSPFESPLLRVAKGEDKETIINTGEPAIILAPSGMLNGGPSYDYFIRMADDEKNTLIFVGYQSSLSLGAKVQQGMREVPIVGDDGRTKTLNVKMRVETVEGFSGHSDRSQLMAYLKNISPRPDRVYTMHGDWNKTEELAKAASHMLKKNIYAPLTLEAVRLR